MVCECCFFADKRCEMLASSQKSNSAYKKIDYYLLRHFDFNIFLRKLLAIILKNICLFNNFIVFHSDYASRKVILS